jgi:hypothetical protein
MTRLGNGRMVGNQGVRWQMWVTKSHFGGLAETAEAPQLADGIAALQRTHPSCQIRTSHLPRQPQLKCAKRTAQSTRLHDDDQWPTRERSGEQTAGLSRIDCPPTMQANPRRCRLSISLDQGSSVGWIPDTIGQPVSVSVTPMIVNDEQFG